MFLIYRVYGNCNTFFSFFKGKKVRKLSRHENLTFEKRAAQNMSAFMLSEFIYLNGKDNTYTYARMKYLLL